jgi:tripartite-type tricarboxylate transporter receptor subunit TctC
MRIEPAATPPERIRHLSEGFAKLVEDRGFLALIGRINSSIQFLGHEAFAKALAEEQKTLRELYAALRQPQ